MVQFNNEHIKYKKALLIIGLVLGLIILNYFANPYIKLANGKNYDDTFLFYKIYLNEKSYFEFKETGGLIKKSTDIGIVSQSFNYSINEDGMIILIFSDETQNTILIYDDSKLYNSTTNEFLYLYTEDK